METIRNADTRFIQVTSPYTTTPAQGVISRFLAWCDIQDMYRFGWVGGTLTVHGCVLTPLTLFAIVLSGNNIYYWVLALLAMGASLVMNLAAEPMKRTIPVFFASVVIDLLIVVACIAHGFAMSGTYN